MRTLTSSMLMVMCLLVFGCNAELFGSGPAGDQGPAGPRGVAGPAGPKGEPGSDSRPGVRLKRQYRISEDGGRAFDSWYDTEIGGPCVWLLAHDGSERCMPSDPRSVHPELRFWDNECKQAVAVIDGDDCGTLPPAMTYRIPGECVYRVRRMSYQVESPANVFALVGDACVPVSLGTNSLVYNLDDEMDATDLMASSVKVE